jgi:hypothetical protein
MFLTALYGGILLADNLKTHRNMQKASTTRLKTDLVADGTFEDLIEKNCQDASIKSTLALVVIFGLSAFMFYHGIFLAGIAIGLAGIYAAIRFSGEYKGGKFWLAMIKENPGNIVWIKPIVTRHTAAFVLTLYKERKFQFLTKDGLKIIMLCNSDEEQQLFLEGVKKYLPDTHIGYSREMSVIYDDYPADFMNGIKKRGLYMPIKVVSFPLV